jgi:hypothetical protein
MSDLAIALAMYAEKLEMVPGILADLDQAEAALLDARTPASPERDRLLAEIKELREGLS